MKKTENLAPFDYLPDLVIQAGAQSDCHPEWPPNFIGHKVKMTEDSINAVISTSVRGEISLNKQISPIVEMTSKKKTVIGSEVEVCYH